MMGTGIEALYIFNQHNDPILQHVYRGRPPATSTLLPLYLAHPVPRPPLIYLPNTVPPTLLFSLLHSQLLFLSPTSVDTEPLLVLEFLHRVTDTLEEFLGAPLLESKIENGYDVIAQLLGEMCDAGAVSNTEPNALRDLVDVPGWMGKLLGGIGLPGAATAPTSSNSSISLQSQSFNSQSVGPQLPWRRANVRHTSNELYVDIIESLSVVIAPSGRPLSAFANGSIAFTSKISGVPDLLLALSSSGGKSSLHRIMELPVFHPCVRLARWREKPGELSFVPPDGRFVLAGYEVDLLPSFTVANTQASISSSNPTNIHLPVSIEVRTGLGPAGADFEVRLSLSNNFPGTTTSGSASGSSIIKGGLGSRLGTSSPAFGGSSNQPVLEGVIVSIPIPGAVRNMTDIRATRGEAHYNHADAIVEWRLPSRDTANLTGSASAILRCTVVGQRDEDDERNNDDEDDLPGNDSVGSTYAYNAELEGDKGDASTKATPTKSISRTQQKSQQATLMPRAATVSFSARGWLASGIKVDSLVVNTKASRGLGEGVRPYKGVKYLTVSRGGVEVRC